MKNKLRITVLILPVVVAIGYGCGKSNKADMPDIPAGKYAGQWREARTVWDTVFYHTEDTTLPGEIQVIDEDEGRNITFVTNTRQFKFAKSPNMMYNKNEYKWNTYSFEYKSDTLYYREVHTTTYGPPPLTVTFRGVRQ